LKALLHIGTRAVVIDLSRPVSLARELDFEAPQPQHFGAPAATSRPYLVPGFSGSVTSGASCNCDLICVIPHCNGTHTECAGHLTQERLDAHRVPPGLVPALLISVVVTAASVETSDPAPQPGDSLITRSAIESALGALPPFDAQALIIRTRATHSAPPAYLSREAAQTIVQRGIQHLVVDLPSIDREHDEGRLTAHRVFFGLPPGSSSLERVTRPEATVTELAQIPDELADGPYLLELQVPAWRGDAVPSRPLLYALRET
jgi:arylformamidase